MLRITILLTIIFAFGLVTLSAQKLQRLPLQKKKIELKTPSSWSKRVVKVDPQTKEEIYYDPKPKIELTDARAGKYRLKWIGYDGKEKVVIYQRPDCVDVVVAALITRSSSGAYEYEYNVRSLATSGDYLHGFAVQNFSTTITPKRPSMINDVLIGNMSSGIFSEEGNWIRFAPVPPHPKVQPGQTIRFKLYSSSPPGLVMCRVDGGDFGTKGVGEDMPGELGESRSALGYQAWPSGYTIGPIEQLKTLSNPERAKYVLELLPQFQKLGWLTATARQRYENILRREDLEAAYKRAEQDLKAGMITTEVLSILQGLKTN